MNGNINTFLNGREWDCRLTTLSNGNVYGRDIVSNFTLTTSQDSSKIIGATIGKQLEIELFTTEDVDYNGLLKLEIGIKLWDEELQKYYFHYFNLGQFYKAETVEQMKYKTKLICFDKMVWGFDGVYNEGNASDMTTTIALKQHVESKFGVVLSGEIPNFEITNPKGQKYRDIISYLAVTSASNTFYDVASDTIKFIPLVQSTTADLEIGKRYYFDYKEDRVEFVIKRINLDMGGNFGYKSGDNDATSDEEVTVTLPWATQEIANFVYNKIKHYEPSGYTMTFLGNPQIEMFDRIKLTTADDKVRYITVQSNKITFNGGLSQELSATKMTPSNTVGSYVENKLDAKINVLSDKITMEVADLENEIEQAKSSIIQTKDEILQTVQNTYLSKQEVSKLYSVVLTNEFQSIPTNSSGYPIESGRFECVVKVYNATEEITDFQLSIGATNSYGIAVSVNKPKVIFVYDKTRQITANSDSIDVTIKVGDDVISRQISWCLAKQGTDGTSFNIKGTLESVDDLPTDVEIGDSYIIEGDLYVFGEDGEWVNAGKIQGEDGKMSTCNIMSNSLTFRSGDGGETWTPSAITLTPYITEANWLNWKYYNNGEWKSHERLGTEVITIAHNDDLISSNQLTLRCNTDVDGCFDIITLQKLSVLDNEVETIKTIAKSEVSQTAEQILSTVSKEYLKKNDADEFVTIKEVNSAIDQKAEQITISVKSSVIEEIEFGAVNLVLDSAVEQTSAQYGFAERTLSEKLIDGKSYTLSVNGRNNSSTGKLRVYIRDNANSFSKYIDITEDKDTTKSITFEAPDGSSNKTFKITAYLYPNGSTETVTVNWYKLERGNFATDWSPCPKDTDILIGNAIEDLSKDLQTQLDDKIQTYYQTTDPSTEWTTTELKDYHVGDIWHDSKNNVTYRWNGVEWSKLTDADGKEAKELAKTKAQVFTSQPTPPYYKGDLWVQGTSGDILRCTVVERTGSYKASDWSKASKYTDDKVANEVKDDLANNYTNTTQMNIAIQAREDSILNTVSKTYTTKDEMGNTLKEYAKSSELTQTEESITAKFSEGGTNLIKNGCFNNDLTHWTNWGSPTSRGVINASTVGYPKALMIVANDTNQGVSQTIDNLEKGKSYTLSAYLNVYSGQCAIQVKSGDNYYSRTSVGTGKQWISRTFTAQDTSANIQLGRHSGGSNGTYYFTAVQLERGEVRTGWTQHPDEIYSGITTIDKDGITVSHSQVSTKSQMNANGFFINDKNGDVIAELSSANQWSTLKADEVFANNIERVYMGNANLYVDHSKSTDGDGSSSYPFNSFASLATHFESKGTILNKDVTVSIVCTSKNIAEQLYLKNLKGNGILKIQYNASCVHRNEDAYNIILDSMDCHVWIVGGRSSYNTSDGAILAEGSTSGHGMKIVGCKNVIVEAINISRTNWGIYIDRSHVRARRVDFCNTWCPVEAVGCSHVSMEDCCGNAGASYGGDAMRSKTGSMIIYGDGQAGSYVPYGKVLSYGGGCWKLGSPAQTASFKTVPAKPATTDRVQTFTSSGYGYYSVGQACWNPNGQKVYQGDWG